MKQRVLRLGLAAPFSLALVAVGCLEASRAPEPGAGQAAISEGLRAALDEANRDFTYRKRCQARLGTIIHSCPSGYVIACQTRAGRRPGAGPIQKTPEPMPDRWTPRVAAAPGDGGRQAPRYTAPTHVAPRGLPGQIHDRGLLGRAGPLEGLGERLWMSDISDTQASIYLSLMDPNPARIRPKST